MNFRLSSLILLLHIQGFLTLDNFNVTCDKLHVCAVEWDKFTVKCSYSNINITTGFWFSQKQRTNWRNKDEPEDLTVDSDYSRRVYQGTTEDKSELIITHLIERDSGEYQLMFIMKDGVKHLSSVTVNLTVSGLQVKMNPESTGQRVKLSCDSSCPFTSEYKYDWYKNGQQLPVTDAQSIFVSSSGNTDSYSCSVSFSSPSSSVCVSNNSCWAVTYTSTEVCALEGSTVDIHSSYSHPTGDTAKKTYWRNIYHGEFRDLHEDPQFAGRVEYLGNTLRIKSVSRRDFGEYQFNIITNTSKEVSGNPGVLLIVTGIRKEFWVLCDFLQNYIMNFRLSSLILLLHIQGSLTLDNFNVTCRKQNICAVRGEEVRMWCSYSNINIKTGFWFSQKQRTNWRNKDEPEDLTLDSDYSGRVKPWITEDNSLLTIYDVRERDSGEYQLMIIMKDGVKHLSSVTVNLTVTGLQVKMNPESTGQRVNLSCDSSCPLTSENDYSWYKNGDYLTNNQSIFVSSSGNTDSYSCSSLSESSLSVCLSNSGCWAVTYTSRRVCALVGSTADIHSSYSHPTGDTVEKTSWYYHHSGEFRDLRDVQFAGRVEFVGNTLRIKDVNMKDTGYYKFRFITNTSDEFSGYPGVHLTVTVTEVISSPNPVIDGEKVILSCSTLCTLDNKHTYIWYKNGQQVTDGLRLLNKLYLDSINSEELQEYSCTVRDSMDKTTETTDRNNEEMDKAVLYSSVFVSLLVFLPQFLIIGAVWIWFLISMNKLNSSKNKTDDKQIEMFQVCE